MQTIISVPALLYQTVIPLWQRTKRLASPYVGAALDLLFCIFWLAALAAVQAWTTSGITDGGKSYCDTFSYGDKDKCVISYGTVLIGVLVFLLWVLASAIAFYLLLFFRRNGYLPNSRPSISNPSIIEPKFSVSTGSSNPSKVEGKPSLNLQPQPQHDVEHGVTHGFTHTDTPLGTHPGRKVSYGNSPPLTAPSRMDIRGAGGVPQFRNVSYRRGNANETTPLSPGMAGPRTGAPRLQVWAPNEKPLPMSPGYGSFAANGPATADVRRLPGQARGVGFWDVENGAGNSFAYDAHRRPSLRNTASQHAAGYSTAHNTPLPTPMGGPATPLARS